MAVARGCSPLRLRTRARREWQPAISLAMLLSVIAVMGWQHIFEDAADQSRRALAATPLEGGGTEWEVAAARRLDGLIGRDAWAHQRRQLTDASESDTSGGTTGVPSPSPTKFSDDTLAVYPPDLFFKRRPLSKQQWSTKWVIVCHVVGIVYMFYGLAVVCDNFFVAALEEMCERWQLTEDVAGATFMAAGGSVRGRRCFVVPRARAWQPASHDTPLSLPNLPGPPRVSAGVARPCALPVSTFVTEWSHGGLSRRRRPIVQLAPGAEVVCPGAHARALGPSLTHRAPPPSPVFHAAPSSFDPLVSFRRRRPSSRRRTQAPELFTSIVGVLIADSDVGFSTIVGSAVFNVLFVIGACAIGAGQILALTWYACPSPPGPPRVRARARVGVLRNRSATREISNDMSRSAGSCRSLLSSSEQHAHTTHERTTRRTPPAPRPRGWPAR